MTERFINNIARFMLGGVFLLFGLNYFFDIMVHSTLEGDAARFMNGLNSAGYFLPFLKTIEIIAGILLISGFFTPLVLIVLSPININIFLFNIFLDPSGLPISATMIIAHVYLLYIYRNNYRGLIRS